MIRAIFFAEILTALTPLAVRRNTCSSDPIGRSPKYLQL
jgi:hypothetical protein